MVNFYKGKKKNFKKKKCKTNILIDNPNMVIINLRGMYYNNIIKLGKIVFQSFDLFRFQFFFFF